MERPELVESPRKRQKTEDVPSADSAVDVLPVNGGAATPDAQTTKEYDVGITELVTGNSEGFAGILKKRYGLGLAIISK